MVKKRMVLIAVTADNHLGRYSARMPVARLEERRRILRATFRRAVDYAVHHRADLFLHAGDLFDTVDPRNAERVMVGQQLARLREVGMTVIGIGGNHDTPRHSGQQGGYHAADIYAALGGMYFWSASRQVESMVVEKDGLTIQIGGASWDHGLAPQDDPLAGLEFADPPEGRADWKILLLHASVEGHRHPESLDPYVRRQTIADFDADVFIIGHEHGRTYFQVGEKHVLVPGATERMEHAEFPHDPGFAVIRLGPRRAWDLSWQRFPAQPRVRIPVSTNELIPEPVGLRPPDEPITEAVLRRVSEASQADQITTLVLSGPLPRDLYTELDLARVQNAGMAANFFFEVRTDELYLANEFGTTAVGGMRLSQRGEIEAAIRELEAQVMTDEQRDALWRCRQRILAYYGETEDAA